MAVPEDSYVQKRLAALQKTIDYVDSGRAHLDALAAFENPPRFIETREEEISNAKRRKPAVQKTLSDEDCSPLQTKLGCIRAKNQAKNYSFGNLLRQLDELGELDEGSLLFQDYAFRIHQQLKDLLNYKSLTITGLRLLSIQIPPQFFLKYLWGKTAKRWGCTKKVKKVYLWERYLVVCCPSEDDFKHIFGENTLVERETDHCCTTGSIQLFSSIVIKFADKSNVLTVGDSLPSRNYAASAGPFLAYNVDRQTLSISVKVQEISPSGVVISKG